MTGTARAASGEGGRIAENVMHFARTLRAAGVPVGPGRVIEAVRALDLVGIRRRDDFYWTLFSIFVARRDHVELFDQAFHVFWRNPKFLERMLSMLLPSLEAERERDGGRELNRRVAEALFGEGEGRDDAPEKIEFDATLTFSGPRSPTNKRFRGDERRGTGECQGRHRATPPADRGSAHAPLQGPTTGAGGSTCGAACARRSANPMPFRFAAAAAAAGIRRWW